MIDREKMKFRFSVLMKETGESIPDDIVSYDDICEHLSSLAGLFEDGFAESLLISLATLRIGESHTCKIPVGESSVTRIAQKTIADYLIGCNRTFKPIIERPVTVFSCSLIPETETKQYMYYIQGYLVSTATDAGISQQNKFSIA